MRVKTGHIQLLAGAILMLAAAAAQAGTTSYYIYDESGHVIGEYDANGNPVQEHIYLGDRPLAVVQGGSGGAVDYVSTDQLDTPRVITDSSQATVWDWNSDPFGNGSSTGTLTYNLRFPGQYADAETGKNYNYYRDYDPTNSRYLESDPIGLAGGLNTYTYAADNPASMIDKKGNIAVPPWALYAFLAYEALELAIIAAEEHQCVQACGYIHPCNGNGNTNDLYACRNKCAAMALSEAMRLIPGYGAYGVR